jgi:Cu2+-exporting ATPase
VTWDESVTSLPALGARIAALGYRPRPVDAEPTGDRDLLTRLGVSAFCAMNVMLLAASVYAGWFDGMDERYAALFRWAQLALATPVALWAAVPFYRAAWTGLRAGVVHMDLPIGVAVAALYAHGLFGTLVGVDGYLDSLSMLVTLLLAGRVAEARGRRSAAAAASAIAAGLPTTARRAVGDRVETVPVDQLAVGDLVEVGLGEEIPVDGVVARGVASVGLALLTGESEPARVGAGDWVVAGAPVLDGAVAVRVERVGEDTLGRRMTAEVLASVDRPLLPTPADRLAPAFTGFAMTAAVGTLAFWTWSAGIGVGIERMAAVLVVACPCALGLSWPIAVSAGLGALARRGVVLRSGDALQRLAGVDLVALDKTGTVTGGIPAVVSADDEVLRIAAGLERASSHPIAAAIRKAAIERDLALPVATDLREEPGVGVSGVLDGRAWRLVAGGPGEVRLIGGDLVGRIVLRDVQRADAADVVGQLKRRARVAMLTGDHPEVAEPLAAQIGADEWRARTTPEDKAGWIAERQEQGRTVLFVGDGLNDGPGLVKADVGLVMRTGAASSVLAADGIVLADGLAPVLAALRVADVVRATVRANLIRSVLYNVTAVTLAALGFVDPLVAALLMPASSLLVLWGGLRVEPRTRREERWT